MDNRQTGCNANHSRAPQSAGFSCTWSCLSASQPGFRWWIPGLILAVSLASGCQSSNHYMAEKLPNSLRLAAQANPQEVDLSRLASATGGSETIGPGDVLEVAIASGLTDKDQIKLPVRIANDGTATLPEIGAVQLAGFPPEAAESLIRMEAIQKNLYQNPSVTVTVTHARKNRIRVLGAVKDPGSFELPPSASDVVSAIAAAGGLAENAGEHVEVRNPVAPAVSRPAIAGEPGSPFSQVSDTTEAVCIGRSMNSYRINLVSAARDGNGSYLVADGGVIMVEKRDPEPIQVIGLVRNPGRYDFPIGKDLHVLDALALAGGVSNQLANKIFVIRPLSNSTDPAVIQLTIREAKRSGNSNLRLGPGDVVSIEQTPSTVLLEALQIIRFGLNGSVGTLF